MGIKAGSGNDQRNKLQRKKRKTDKAERIPPCWCWRGLLAEMQVLLVKRVEESEEVVLFKLGASFLVVAGLRQNLHDEMLDRLRCGCDVVEGAVSSVVFLQQLNDLFVLEDGTQCLVLSFKAETHETIPLKEVDRWRGVPGFNTNDGRLDLGRRFETHLTHFDNVVHFSQQLSVDRKAAVLGVSHLGIQSLGKLLLVHKQGATEKGSVCDEFECNNGRNLVWQVGNADIEERKLDFHHISMNDFQFVGKLCTLNTFLKLGNHSRIILNRNHFLRLPQQLHGHVTSTRSNFKNSVCRLDARSLNNSFDYQRVL